jgi:hypothetical protein
MVGGALALICAYASVFGIALTACMSHLMGQHEFFWLEGVLAALGTFSAMAVALVSIDSHVCCFFVCLAEDAEVAQEQAADVYSLLMEHYGSKSRIFLRNADRVEVV